jgi:hypothetical protein
VTTDDLPFDLCDTITGLDNDNTARLITAIRYATGNSHLRFVVTFHRNRRVRGSR